MHFSSIKRRGKQKKNSLNLLLNLGYLIVKTGKMSNAVQKPSFETIPTEVRLEIYRELLLLIEEDFVDPAMSGNDMGDDSTSDDSGKKLHVAILRCNKKIHREANGVLYGENTFHFQLTAERKVKLWHQHFLEESPTRVSRRCSRLITKVHLSIDPLGHEFGFHGIVCATGTMRINLNHVVSKLALNDLKLLDIHFINRPGFDHPFSAFLQQRGINIENEFGPLYYGEECLEPLLKLRATTVSQPALPKVRFTNRA